MSQLQNYQHLKLHIRFMQPPVESGQGGEHKKKYDKVS